MVAKKRLNVREPERSLLTDTLPYEVPLFFHNANLAILARQFRLNQTKHLLHTRLLLADDAGSRATRPLNYEIRKDSKSMRKLSLPHPKSQHRMCQFYEKFDHLISNSCGRSLFSIRYPSRVATHYVDPTYAAANTKSSKLEADEDPAGFRDQHRWASTYFSYRDFNLSHKFFESIDFFELERRYALLMTLDIAQCFNSIYTHSIEWSMRGKEFSKDFLPSPPKNRSTFESEFDSSVRHGNWNETHGILVGPEYSRIFAEIVLQSADREIYKALKNRETGPVEIKRYVDDYFIFANSNEDLDKTEAIIAKALSELNLHLNASKRDVSPRPFISRFSVSRQQVAGAVDRFFELADFLFDAAITPPESSSIERARTALITRLRCISVELQTPYERFASFALTVMKRKMEELLGRITSSTLASSESTSSKLSWLTSIIRTSQFLYSMDHRATTTLKLASVYSLATELAEKLGCARASLEHQVLDGLRDPSMGYGDPGVDEIAKINHVCAVDLLLTQDRRIEEQDIRSYIGDVTDAKQAARLSEFQLIAVLFLCRRRSRFAMVLRAAYEECQRRISSPSFKPTLDSAHALILTEVLACPYLDSSQKRSQVRHAHMLLFGSDCGEKSADQILNDGSWISFVEWGSVSDLASMLARKELTPAYE